MTKNRKKIQSYIICYDQPIGKGTYGQVFMCLHDNSKTSFAVKIVKKYQRERIHESCDETVISDTSFSLAQKYREVDMPLLRFVDVIQTANNYYIIQEYCQGGDLRALIKAHHKLSQPDAQHCLKGLCSAFQEMCAKGVIHRDLKPENILIHNNELKIADFGFAKKLFSQRQMTQTMIGTPLYMAPQILKKERYSSKCDIWSVGIIYYELLFGKHPWKGKDMHSLYHNIASVPLEFPSDVQISENSKSFLIHALQIEEIDRLSWLEVYEHDLLGNQFKQKAEIWRQKYQIIAKKLNSLSEDVQVEQLIGGFLQLRVASLTFDLFSLVMNWLVKDLQQRQLGIMYELFDKDQNGVIDFEQFILAFGKSNPQTIGILNKLIMRNHFHQQLKDRQKFIQLCSEIGIDDNQKLEQAYSLIENIILEQ